MTIGEIAARIPLTLSDVLIVGGFGCIVYGLWLSFGLGPTLIAAGGACIWVGGQIYKGSNS